MQQSELEIGKRYCFREKPRARSPILRVTLVQIVGRGGKVKVRHEDEPHAGLEEFARSAQLLCRLGDRHALERDELTLGELQRRVERLATPSDWVVREAATTVLDASGEHVWSPTQTGMVLRTSTDAIERLAGRTGFKPYYERLDPSMYRDRFGTVHVTFDVVVEMAKAFAAAEPSAVALHLESEERELTERGHAPGGQFYHQFLRERRPAYAMVRQWLGPDNQLADLRAENDRLRLLLGMAAQDLDDAGADLPAMRLRRTLGR